MDDILDSARKVTGHASPRPRTEEAMRAVLAIAVCLATLSPANADPAAQASGGEARQLDARQQAILQEYAARELMRDAVADQIERDSGKPFSEYTIDDYAAFLGDLDLDRDDDLWRWSQVAGIPIVALRQESEFFRDNAHLLSDLAAAKRMPAKARSEIRSVYDPATGELRLLASDGRPLPIRDVGSTAVRALEVTAQIRHNKDFAADGTILELLGPYLARLRELEYRNEIGDRIRSLPLAVVKVLRGKALYLSTRRGERCDALSYYVGSDQYPGYAGLQPGVLVEDRSDGTTADALVRGIGRILQDTVLKGDFYGLYVYSNQFPEFQKLAPERRRVFGQRRARLPQTPYGYIGAEARVSATENFVEHFLAYVTRKESFHEQALGEQAQGHPQLMEKFRFLERLVESTPPTLERLSRENLVRVDFERQREILEEYLAGQARRKRVVAQVRKQFGRPLPSFTPEDYARFMARLDLNRDEDLWTWSHATGIPIVALSQRSNFFHKNAHLLEDANAAGLMSWEELTGIRSILDERTNRLQLLAGTGRRLQVRDLPEDLIQRTQMAHRVSSDGDDTTEHRIVFEALEPWLVSLGDLENREELSEGIRLLPLSIVKAHRGKAFYPTTRSKTGWAVSWPVSNDKNVTYVGMCSGSFIEPRRDIRRVC